MNVDLEQEGLTPEKRTVSPREYKKAREQALVETGAIVDSTVSPANERLALAQAERKVSAADRLKISEFKQRLDNESVPDQTRSWLLRETIRIEKFSTILNERRAEAENGVYGTAWEVIEAFEVTDRKASDDVLRARRAFKEFVEELNEADSSTTDSVIAQRIATRFFKETGYKFTNNSLLQSLANGEPMNCAGRFKAVAATLEGLGYNPATEIFVNETRDHIRTVLKTKEGAWLIDGKRVIPYVAEDGTAEMPLNDYKRELLGLDPEQRVVHGGTVDRVVLGSQKSWLGKVINKLFPDQKHEISNTRRGHYDNLKSMDTNNRSRVEHLIPGPILALMKSQLLADANAVIERMAGGAVDIAKALAAWRGTKLAAGGGLAMAMYSACGPIIEKYSEAKSPDEAAAMIHSDISDVRLALEEHINSVAKAVEIAAKEWHKEKPEDKKIDKEDAVKNSSELAGGAASGWTDRVAQEQSPIDQLIMTKEEMYLLFAEKDLSYDSVDLILDKSDTKGEIDISKPLTIDVGEARVLSPTFFKYFLQRGSIKKEEEAMQSGFGPIYNETVPTVYIKGKFVDEITSTAAWQVAINELEDTNRIQKTAHTFYETPLIVTVNGTELIAPIPAGQEDKGDTPGSEDWRYGLGGVPDWYIVSQAQQIAVAMGETEAGDWKAARKSQFREQEKTSYLDHLADEYKAVPIGYYDRPDGSSAPVFNELDKAQWNQDGLVFRAITGADAEYVAARVMINEKNDIAEAIITQPVRVPAVEKNNNIAKSILAAAEAKAQLERLEPGR